ncbi:DDE-type integrase/transposase/recombinase [Paenibacillus sp. LMG 31461]|uniref:DDE-type integrase/transposase/recombinase n=1 Tax=Paenibacillus plantarum TaxID=2654975 RepID=A0ABX1X481_9BACL|nr:Mu transposase C-terminal domain-containing protein [Paenibacillus plantarum]NOU63223.1 DDE-type integrase/transposase/recombinase [Paenibacillus plantarum]
MSLFKHGLMFILDGKEYVVKKVNKNDIDLELVNYNIRESWLLEDLLQAWNDGRLLLKSKATEHPFQEQDLGTLPIENKATVEKRFEILKPYLEGKISGVELDNHLKLHNISRSTFYNWRRKWLWAKDIRYLVSNEAKRGPKVRRVGVEIKGLVEQILKDFVYSGPKFSMKALHRELKKQITELNEQRAATEKLKLISYDTFTRVYKENIDLYRISKVMNGKENADLERYGSMGKISVEAALERIELDWTKLDLILVDPITGRRFRIWLIVAIDVYTGSALGFYLTEKVDTSAIKQCLLHCFMPKTYIKKMYPKVKNEWPAFGIPQEVVLDNASSNESYDLQDACRTYGIDVQYCTVASGHQKGVVERFFRSLNQAIIHCLPGTTFSNVQEKGQYDSVGEACITLQGLYSILHLIIVDNMVNGWSYSRNGVPAQLWKKSLEENPELELRLPSNKKDLQIVMGGGLEHRKVSKTGVKLAKLNFQSDALMDLKYEMLRKGCQNEDVRIRYDMSDMRTIFIWDPYKETYIEAFPDYLVLESLGLDTSLPIPWEQIKLFNQAQQELKNEFDDTPYADAVRAALDIANMERKAMNKRAKDGNHGSSTGNPFPMMVNPDAVHSVHGDVISSRNVNTIDKKDPGAGTLPSIDFVDDARQLIDFKKEGESA